MSGFSAGSLNQNSQMVQNLRRIFTALSINTVSTEPGKFPIIHQWGTEIWSTREILKAETENKQSPNHTKFVPMAGLFLAPRRHLA